MGQANKVCKILHLGDLALVLLVLIGPCIYDAIGEQQGDPDPQK